MALCWQNRIHVDGQLLGNFPGTCVVHDLSLSGSEMHSGGRVEKTDLRSADYPLTPAPRTALRTTPRTTLRTTPTDYPE